jgi:hypothetical protein
MNAIDIDWSRKRERCPVCGKGNERGSSGTLGISDAHEGGRVAHCFRCELVARSESPKRTRTSAEIAAERARRHAAELDQARKRDAAMQSARRTWRETVGLRGTLGETYLRARGCAIPPVDSECRFHHGLLHWPSGEHFPALVARVSSATDAAKSLTLHCTYLDPSGTRKAPVERPRLLWPNLPSKHGAIRLWPDDCVTLGLGVGEGIETSLSLAIGFAPVWSLIDAANLAAFPALEGIESLTIAADHDQAGIAAASSCAERWRLAGRQVRIVIADEQGKDMNDVVLEAR